MVLQLNEPRIERIDPFSVEVSSKELSARLGMPNSEIDIGILDSVRRASSPVTVAMMMSVTVGEGAVMLGNNRVESRDFASFLDGCDRVILLCATLGAEIDRYVTRLAVRSVADQFFADAYADILIEGVCDRATSSLGEGLNITHRYSPGYGDLSLDVSLMIQNILLAEKRIGVMRCDSGLMTPKKTVTALIGVKRK